MYLGLPDIVSNKNRREEGRFFCVCNKNPSLYLAATQSVCSHGDYGGQEMWCYATHMRNKGFFYSSPLFGFKAAQHGHVTSKVESLYKLFKVFFFQRISFRLCCGCAACSLCNISKARFLAFLKGRLTGQGSARFLALFEKIKEQDFCPLKFLLQLLKVL